MKYTIDINRVRLAVAKQIFGLNSPEFWRLYKEIQQQTYGIAEGSNV